MKILLVTATWIEIKNLISNFSIKKTSSPISFNINNNNIDIVVTGVGIFNTAFALGKILSTNKYDIAINIGIAGTFDENKLPLTSLCNVISDAFTEFGKVSSNDISFLKSIDNETFSSFNKNREVIYIPMNNKLIETLPLAKGKTSNIIKNKINKKYINKNQNIPYIETMEGAAFFFCSYKNRIPSAQIRCISNIVGDTNKKNWQINEAIANLNNFTIQLLSSF